MSRAPKSCCIWMTHVACRTYECVTHMNASCHTFEWGMARMWMHRVARRIWYIWMRHVFCHTYEWVTHMNASHIWMSHVTRMNEAWRTCECIVSHVAHMNASCLISHIWMSHACWGVTYQWVTCANESHINESHVLMSHAYQWVTCVDESHIWMRHA